MPGPRNADPNPATSDSDVSSDSNPASVSSIRSDTPIDLPEHDFFGIDDFARALAKSVSNADVSNGMVYAINGPWGSGKSSAINLIEHHLANAISEGKVEISRFNPWWFAGSEALTISFFQELRATVGKSLDDKAREAMASFGSRLSSAGPLLGGIASIYATPAAGAAVTGGATLLEKLTRLESTVEKQHRKVADALKSVDKRFLIVLDDIDRLSTDDALQIFKLVKSVGRLPNVVYLLAFDRHLAEKMIAEKFPAEGVSYLEKVIQGAFDLPLPDPEDLQRHFLANLESIIGSSPDNKMQRFWNIFYDVVAPLMKTPRDTVRLSNALSVSWPAVTEEVDRADFMAIEALRLFLPSVYEAVRAHPDMLTGTQSQRGGRQENLASTYDDTFLSNLTSRHRDIAKRSLRRLFPKLDAIWSNTWHNDARNWQKDRLICSPEHFRTYFAFGIANEGITSAESNRLVDLAGVPGATVTALSGFLLTTRRKGGTRAALALDELNVRASDIAKSSVQQFLCDIFSIADDLDVESDKTRGFGMADNNLRLNWLLNNILLERFDLTERSELVRQAANYASLEWLVSLSDRCKRSKDKTDTEHERRNEDIVNDDIAEWMYDLSLKKIRAAAESGEMIEKRRLIRLMFAWKYRTTTDEVKDWANSQLHNVRFIVAIAADAIDESWSHGVGGFGWMGDRVAVKSEYVNTKQLSNILDVGNFKNSLSVLLAGSEIDQDQRQALERFMRTADRDPEKF